MLKFIRANKTKHGGAEVYLSRLSSELTVRNIRHTLVHSEIPKFLPSWIRVLLFNRQVCHEKKKNDFYFSLERISCPDVYRAGDGVHKVFMDIERKSKINPLHRVYLSIEKRAFSRASKIIAISNMVKQNIIDTYHIDPSKIEVVYNGISLKPFNKQQSLTNLSKEFTINEHDKIITYVGSGFKRKGVEEFLRILSKLQYRNYKAFVIGKEKKMQYYKELTVSLGIDKKVLFTAARDDVDDFYTISDIFLFPTKYEPFGNVILEAMNYGNAVITTKSCGGGEILDDDYIMQTPNDLSIVPKIDALLSDELMLQKVKERNLEIVQNFTIEKNVEKTLKVINEVIC